MKKKILSTLVCLTVAATTIIGCGSQAPSSTGTDTPAAETKTEETKTEEKAADTTAEASGDKVTLSIYTQYADDDTKVPYDYAVEQLAEAFPNVELNLIVQAQDDGQTLKTLAATGQLPDIYQASTDIINTFRESNQIMVLNDVAQSTGFLDKLYDANKDLAYADDGNIYAFPFSGQEYVLWYTIKLFLLRTILKFLRPMMIFLIALKYSNLRELHLLHFLARRDGTQLLPMM